MIQVCSKRLEPVNNKSLNPDAQAVKVKVSAREVMSYAAKKRRLLEQFGRQDEDSSMKARKAGAAQMPAQTRSIVVFVLYEELVEDDVVAETIIVVG